MSVIECGQIVLLQPSKNGVIIVTQGSLAELHTTKPVYVTLKAHDWIGKDICELSIVCNGKRILTDYGYARLDMGKVPINFGATDGTVDNGEHLTRVMLKASDAYLAAYAFELEVFDSYGSVRFKLNPVSLKTKEPISRVPKLELSAYFETTLATFCSAVPSSSTEDDAPKAAVAA